MISEEAPFKKEEWEPSPPETFDVVVGNPPNSLAYLTIYHQPTMMEEQLPLNEEHSPTPCEIQRWLLKALNEARLVLLASLKNDPQPESTIISW